MWRFVLVFVGLFGWVLLGEPTRDLANLFWPDAPAPWETVDGVYYPDRYDLSFYEEKVGFADLEECRDWVASRAFSLGDRGIRLGDYECGFGFLREWGGGKVYRNTAR